MHTHEYKSEHKNMLILFHNGFLTNKHDICFSCFGFKCLNDTKSNLVIYCFIYCSIDTQYCLSITKMWVT